MKKPFRPAEVSEPRASPAHPGPDSPITLGGWLHPVPHPRLDQRPRLLAGRPGRRDPPSTPPQEGWWLRA